MEPARVDPRHSLERGAGCGVALLCNATRLFHPMSRLLVTYPLDESDEAETSARCKARKREPNITAQPGHRVAEFGENVAGIGGVVGSLRVNGEWNFPHCGNDNGICGASLARVSERLNSSISRRRPQLPASVFRVSG